ncbi:MAG: hypothetical protein ACYTAQ_05850 [Planctomycetota bacterium]
MQKLTQHLDQLPLVLKETAEIKGQCGQVLEQMGEQLKEARSRDDAAAEAVTEAVNSAVTAGVERLAQAASRDGQALDRIEQLAESNAQALRMAGETEDGVSQNLRQVLESSARIQRTVAEIKQSHEGRDAEIAKHFAASKRTMMMLAFACTLASLLALAVAVIALLT